MAVLDSSSLIDAFDRLVRRDPAQRGLISTEPQFGPLCSGHLRGAAVELAERATCVGLVTGFFIPAAEPACAETDGPPGAVLLAAVLQAMGKEVLLLTDETCRTAVIAAAVAMGLAQSQVCVPDPASLDAVQRDVERRCGRRLSHLVSVERVGPSHTLQSLAGQMRSGASPIDAFAGSVPEGNRDRCHNMRGTVIDAWTGPLHRLFEESADAGVRTVGIGDGGNEIGMGRIAWEELRRRLPGEQGALIPCRIATDWTIVAGTSNWGAAALAAAAATWRGRADILQPWDCEQQRAVLQAMVERGPAVDGITRRQEATVDGLPFLTYIQPWEGMRRLLGHERASRDPLTRGSCGESVDDLGGTPKEQVTR